MPPAFQIWQIGIRQTTRSGREIITDSLSVICTPRNVFAPKMPKIGIRLDSTAQWQFNFLS